MDELLGVAGADEFRARAHAGQAAGNHRTAREAGFEGRSDGDCESAAASTVVGDHPGHHYQGFGSADGSATGAGRRTVVRVAGIPEEITEMHSRRLFLKNSALAM